MSNKDQIFEKENRTTTGMCSGVMLEVDTITLSKQQNVSESVSESVCLFPISYETANPNELKF